MAQPARVPLERRHTRIAVAPEAVAAARARSDARTHLELVPRRRRAARWATAVAVAVVAAMMGAAAFQTYLAKGQLELDRLDRQMAVTAANYETLRQERAELRSPGRLTAVAAERGMEPATKTSFIAISPEVLVLVRQATGALDPTFDDEAELLAQFRAVKALRAVQP